MGKELEYKLFVPGEAQLAQILADGEIAALAEDGWHETPMRTTYYDGADHRFSRRDWTFRRRMEGAKSVVCLKTPTASSHLRGEWQVLSDAADAEAVELLVQAGAPEELRALYAAGTVVPVCGAEFLRRSVILRFPDGSRAELAGDSGFLHGRTEQLAFTELELELYEGEPAQMLALVRRLCERYGLRELRASKYARAKSLS